MVHVEVIVLNRGTFSLSHFPLRTYLLVNIIKIVVVLVVVVVVEVVGDVGHHGEDADRHGEEGHLGEGDRGGVRQGGAGLPATPSVQRDVHHALLTLQSSPALPLSVPLSDEVKDAAGGRLPLFIIKVSPGLRPKLGMIQKLISSRIERLQGHLLLVASQAR